MQRKHITSTRYSDAELAELQRRAALAGFDNVRKWEREHIHKFEPIRAGAPPKNTNRKGKLKKSITKP
jgi:hypothetical protein